MQSIFRVLSLCSAVSCATIDGSCDADSSSLLQAKTVVRRHIHTSHDTPVPDEPVVEDEATEDVVTGGVTVQVLGKSGKFRMFSTQSGRNDPNMITVELDSLRELDANGDAVGSSGQDRHSIQTFANQDFTFHPAVQNFMLGRNLSVSATKLSFESPVGEVGNIEVDTLVMNNHGVVGPEGDEWDVGTGDMKFNIRFPNWRWCGDAGSSCRNGEVGEFLELNVKVKGNASAVSLEPGTLNTYNLGGGASLTLTDKVMLDGELGQMATGYPQLRMQGSSQIFTFRFPKFSTSAEYDPLVSQSWVEEESSVEEEATEDAATPAPVVEEEEPSFEEQATEDVVTGGVTVQVLGQSGKFRMFSTEAGHNDPNVITVEMDSLRELDANGDAVGSSGQDRHSIQTFANQDFTFHPAVQNFMMGRNLSVSATKLSFESPVGEVGNIEVDTLVMNNNGVVGPEGDAWEVGMGDMKFNIRFPNWRWCGDAGSSCRNGEVGEFLELNIKVKGAASAVSLEPGTLNTYNLGGGASLTLTDKVMLDGEQGQMATGYPQLRTQGSSQIFTFRFPKFSTSAEYDPLLSQTWVAEEGEALETECAAHRTTPGTCRWFGCYRWRGDVDCVDGRCVCAEGLCSTNLNGRRGVCRDPVTWAAARDGLLGPTRQASNR